MKWDLLQVWNLESFLPSRRNGPVACGPSRVSYVQCCCLQQETSLASLHLSCAVHIRGTLGWYASKSFLGNCEHLGETSSPFLLFSLHFFFSPCSLLFLFTPFFHLSSLFPPLSCLSRSQAGSSPAALALLQKQEVALWWDHQKPLYLQRYITMEYQGSKNLFEGAKSKHHLIDTNSDTAWACYFLKKKRWNSTTEEACLTMGSARICCQSLLIFSEAVRQFQKY